MKIKFCGLKNEQDLEFAKISNVNYIGINFYKKSKRFIGRKFFQIINKIPSYLTKIALFVNNEKKEILDVIDKFDLIQFHGNENFDFCNSFNKNYIKSININDKINFFNFNKNKLKFILLDKISDFFGGSGMKFKHFKLNLNIPIIISGGINFENLNKIIKITSAKIIDICSGIEYKKIKNIIKMLKRYEN